MIHELREYRIDAAIAQTYFALFREVAMPIRGEAFGRLVGNWMTPGPQIAFYHIWEYASLGDRTTKRAQLAAIDGWRLEFLPAAARCITSQHISILHPQDAESRGSLEDDGPLRLTTLRCATGSAAAVAAATAGVHHPPHMWIEEMPDPNTVHYLAPAVNDIEFDFRVNADGIIGASYKTLQAGPYRL
jgi:hypothetical protein